jgi:hypothetical protein
MLLTEKDTKLALPHSKVYQLSLGLFGFFVSRRDQLREVFCGS